MTETIPQMRERHAREIGETHDRLASYRAKVLANVRLGHAAEIKAAMESLAAERITQAEAARRNGMNLTAINNLVHRLGIFWPVKRQGVRS